MLILLLFHKNFLKAHHVPGDALSKQSKALVFKELT